MAAKKPPENQNKTKQKTLGINLTGKVPYQMKKTLKHYWKMPWTNGKIQHTLGRKIQHHKDVRYFQFNFEI